MCGNFHHHEYRCASGVGAPPLDTQHLMHMLTLLLVHVTENQETVIPRSINPSSKHVAPAHLVTIHTASCNRPASDESTAVIHKDNCKSGCRRYCSKEINIIQHEVWIYLVLMLHSPNYFCSTANLIAC